MTVADGDRRLVVGIDLGTTHTVVAFADPTRVGPPEVFPIPQLVAPGEIEARPLFPSFLFAPPAGESAGDPWGDAPWIAGELARRRGGEVPGRLVASAKSWLCHAGVDRTAAILPWGLGEEATDVPRISPVDVAARLLGHVRAAWNDAHPARPLEGQDIVLTVPASFDEVARELTLEAARRAGLPVRLLEEPQAAFYDYMQRVPHGLEALAAEHGEALVLVCDVGGGTTDLSLIQVRKSEGEASAAGPFTVERVAVGHHLLLGGDNMDLALAHLCEPRLVGPEGKLDAARFGQLVLACRAAKERLLGDDPPADVPVTVLSAGAKLVGSARSTRLAREEVERVVFDGFLPAAPRDARPARARTALVAFGLPYERDVAITRHLAWFFARHAPGEAGPRALLLNGGVFRASRIAARLAQAIEGWGGPPLEVLPHADPDLAVARGAVAYGLALRGLGLRIEGGAPRGYYVGVGGAVQDGRKLAVCVVPRGAREGMRQVAEGRMFALTVGRPVRFDLYASEDAALHRPGEVVAIDDERFSRLPPVATSVAAEPAVGAKGGAGAGPAREVRVALEGELMPIGTLELSCVEVGVEGREPQRFRLTLQVREPVAEEPAGWTPSSGASPEAPSLPMSMTSMRSSRAGAVTPGGKRIEEARAAIERAFGKSREGGEARDAKNLVRELERILGERGGWTTELARTLFDALTPHSRSRKRTPDHERVFWQLAGFCLRPGFGDPLDPTRVARIAPLFSERLAFPQEARGWQQLWIAFRRIAAGLDEAFQISLRDATDPLIAPAEKRLKKPKGLKLEAEGDLLDLVSSLERVPAARRSELGSWILERTWTSRDPRLWAALGRIGARVPTYASVHHVVSPPVAERWIDHLLREKWADLPSAPQAAVQLARVTDDRARDVSERVRREVERRLVSIGAKEDWIRAVREHVPVAESERVAFFGENLPVGLRLVD